MSQRRLNSPAPPAAPLRVPLVLGSLGGGEAERVAVNLMNRCDPSAVHLRLGSLRRTDFDIDAVAQPYADFFLEKAGVFSASLSSTSRERDARWRPNAEALTVRSAGRASVRLDGDAGPRQT